MALHTASRGKLIIRSGSYSVAGVKPINEDAFTIQSPQKPSLSTKGIVAIVADGVSHASQAAKASQYATQTFSNDYYKTPKTWSTQHIISDLIKDINKQLFFNSEDSQQLATSSNTNLTSLEKPQWLTTFSGIIFKSASAHIFHIGDTQIARVRDEKITLLTVSHNQKLTKNTSVLTRALGADNHIQVDYQQQEVRPGDIYLLTSDGVHETISSDVFLKRACLENDLDQLSRNLVESAIANGSQDNLTCLALKIDKVPVQDPNEIRKTLMQKVVPPALKVGQILEGYRVLSHLHASSRSHLYLVEEISTSQRFTLKAPSINFSDDEIYLQGFIREAWVGSQIDHPAIMKVYPSKTDSKFLYHICEYIQGQTLRQWMIDHPMPNIESVRQIINQVIAGLRLFKKLEIIHRDIKPENIMVDDEGQIKLIDYGTASIAAIEEQINRLVETHPLGTVNYIAPETLYNLTSTYQSDLFSVGVMTYELLTGKLPYKKSLNRTSNKTKISSENQSFQKWQYRSALEHRPDIPFWFDLALRQAVEADPSNRYHYYSEFLTDITKPNKIAEQEFKNRPFIERDPVMFWKIISGILAIGLVTSIIF